MTSDQDPSLVSLFAHSLGPTKTNSKGAAPRPKIHQQRELSTSPILDSGVRHPPKDLLVTEESRSSYKSGRRKDERFSSRKRKRALLEDDVEETYWRTLAKEDQEERRTTPKASNHHPNSTSDGDSANLEENSSEENTKDEVLGLEKGLSTRSESNTELEKSERTVFLSNVAAAAIKSKSSRKVLARHLTSFQLPDPSQKPRIESIRFRSTAFAEIGIPRKAAFAKKNLMDSTTSATNAYAVYSTQLAAHEACKKLNGTQVLDRHLRVDSVTHPAIRDHHRCVFIGNLGFVDVESSEDVAQDPGGVRKTSKHDKAADVEEGLWREFGKIGGVEYVRVIRDKGTRVGKGIAYVQFKEKTNVERALLLNGKKFPPLLPRPLRVSRAWNLQRATRTSQTSSQKTALATSEGQKSVRGSQSSKRTKDVGLRNHPRRRGEMVSKSRSSKQQRLQKHEVDDMGKARRFKPKNR